MWRAAIVAAAKAGQCRRASAGPCLFRRRRASSMSLAGPRAAASTSPRMKASYLRRRNRAASRSGQCAATAAVDELVVELDIGRGVDGPAEELLLERQIAVEIEDAQAAFEHGEEGVELVVLRDLLVRLRLGFERQPIVAGRLRRVGELDLDLAVVFVGADRAAADGLRLIFVVGQDQLDGQVLLGIAADADESADDQLVFHEDGELLVEPVDGDVAGLGGIARQAERDRVERRGEIVAELAGGLLRFDLRLEGGLRAVAQQQHAGERFALLGLQRFAERRANVGLLAGGRVGELDLAAGELERTQFLVVAIDANLRSLAARRASSSCARSRAVSCACQRDFARCGRWADSCCGWCRAAPGTCSAAACGRS